MAAYYTSLTVLATAQAGSLASRWAAGAVVARVVMSPAARSRHRPASKGATAITSRTSKAGQPSANIRPITSGLQTCPNRPIAMTQPVPADRIMVG